MKKLRLLFLTFTLLLSCSCDEDITQHNATNNGDGNGTVSTGSSKPQKILYDVSYGDAPRHKLDIFLPSGRKNNTKAVLLIPGGGWTSGDKEGFEGAAKQFFGESIAAFTMNYRYANISDGITYAEMLEDIDMAIEYIVSKSDEYVFSPAEITLLGHSAGAHLALLYTYRDNKLNRVTKVISAAGATDFTSSLLQDMPNTGMNGVLEIVVGSNETEKWEDASPVFHESPITTYLYHGKKDEIIPYQQSETLFDIIKSKNTKNKYVLFEDETHDLSGGWNQIMSESIALIKN